MTYRQGGDTAQSYAPRAQEGAEKMPIITGKLTGPLKVEGCGGLAEFLLQAPWDEQRDRLIATESELEKHLTSEKYTCYTVVSSWSL